jgi:DNA repair protein RadA/Sms
MARAVKRYVCQACGAVGSKWQGKCDACGAWNAILEEAALEAPGFTLKAKGNVVKLAGLDGGGTLKRFETGIGELDRTLGGGIVPGSAILIGGEPGIGKSTLVLQALAELAATGKTLVYVTGEESLDQIRMRASRLGLAGASLKLAAETQVRDILATLADGPRPDVVVIDSIQTMYSDALDAAPGTVTQVRLSAQNLIHFAKTGGAALLLIGHVTKDGQIAGPKTMEHMVDTVLYFEGERTQQYRILRATKNRFGGVDEIGVFEMTGEGLKEVKNPSSLFLTERKEAAEGVAVFPALEGTRALLAEIEALVVPSPGPMPRRAVVGWDQQRLAMILAVLDAKLGLGFGASDVYLNVAGGLKIAEPAADLAVAAALMSSLTKRALPADMVLLGEISLSGDIRPVVNAAIRLKEAEKMGFERAVVPKAQKTPATSLRLLSLEKVRDLPDLFDTAR